jgi:hypothetical protein
LALDNIQFARGGEACDTTAVVRDAKPCEIRHACRFIFADNDLGFKMTISGVIAERKLLFSEKGSGVRREMSVRIHAPFELKHGDVEFRFHRGTAGCRVEFFGLDEPDYLAHGVDSLQAIAFAVDVDPILKKLSEKIDFYFEDGEPYFCDL